LVVENMAQAPQYSAHGRLRLPDPGCRPRDAAFLQQKVQHGQVMEIERLQFNAHMRSFGVGKCRQSGKEQCQPSSSLPAIAANMAQLP
jgi:hypothetical protein